VKIMAGEDRVLAGGAKHIDFQTDPSRYRHWKLDVAGDVATLTMDVDENGGLFEGYQLKLNSYDLGVDIELADAVQRLRFEHPGVKVVLLRSGKNRVFCAGANIRMLAGATHAHKVNFCKFTNETRNGLEDSTENSGQRFVTVINGTAAGGGYELALATDHIILADDGSAAVALPEVPLLAVLPGTGGLTRVVDKRKVRRDHADYFCTIEEGIKGKRAVQWRLVDEIVPNSKLEAKVAERAKEFAAASKRNGSGNGIALTPLARSIDESGIRYGLVSVDIDRNARIATISIPAPDAGPPADIDGMIAQGSSFWPLQVARELDDAILHLRINELDTAMLVFKSHGESANVLACDAGRARLLLCRLAGRTGVRGRPLLHADRLTAGRQPQPAGAATERHEFRALSDEPWPDAAAIALPGRSVGRGSSQSENRRGAGCGSGRAAWPCDVCARRHRLG
jgi:benzoyl-CoA-dihydrodiol lyase